MFNKTRKAFVQIGVFGVNVAWGFLEEITENITHPTAANAAEYIEVSDKTQGLIKFAFYAFIKDNKFDLRTKN